VGEGRGAGGRSEQIERRKGGGQMGRRARAVGKVGEVSRKREGKEEGRRAEGRIGVEQRETEWGNYTRLFLGRALGRSVMLMLNLV
jgi:hypothetical protein